ncbi:SDR family oxidoreductase [Puniceibacterium sediminis]|uniref:3-oxoacyl-[acyl-carrier protein] reductase n=1 Tax=Puniceibacterium sediminis TaxID=1608407 RepID=A0A238X5M4_9RHOB|nr:SDR family oxidoreductase [Puniceibacterium sediminis]SNR54355.1 3-oxoacyl-[acyl-carrier protein] reductase [Puniceibacterium sediminis]
MTRKTAIVFGGSRGIGAAIVQALTRDGFDVALTYTSKAPAAPTAPNGATITLHKADIRNADDVAAVFAAVGRAPDCVVANAGINVPPGPIAQFPDDSFRDLVEVNIVGAFHVLRAAAANVADGGTIIGLTTSLVRVAVPGVGPYSATKAAVECLLRSMSKELAGRGVRVNGVAPGPVDTDLFRSGKDEAALQRSASLSPFNRVGKPEEVAEVVSFLASDRASWVHGQIVQPNGGLV